MPPYCTEAKNYIWLEVRILGRAFLHLFYFQSVLDMWEKFRNISTILKYCSLNTAHFSQITWVLRCCRGSASQIMEGSCERGSVYDEYEDGWGRRGLGLNCGLLGWPVEGLGSRGGWWLTFHLVTFGYTSATVWHEH